MPVWYEPWSLTVTPKTLHQLTKNFVPFDLKWAWIDDNLLSDGERHVNYYIPCQCGGGRQRLMLANSAIWLTLLIVQNVMSSGLGVFGFTGWKTLRPVTTLTSATELPYDKKCLRIRKVHFCVYDKTAQNKLDNIVRKDFHSTLPIVIFREQTDCNYEVNRIIFRLVTSHVASHIGPILYIFHNFWANVACYLLGLNAAIRNRQRNRKIFSDCFSVN